MINIILSIIKYLIMILFAFFVFISFRAQRDVPDTRKRASFNLQRILIILIHFFAFLSMFINIRIRPEIEVKPWPFIAFYAGQLVYLLIMLFVVPRLTRISISFNNVMCAFLSIGFIIQTRLNFETAVRHFIIVAVSSAVFLIVLFVSKKASFLRNLTWVYCIAGLVMLSAVVLLSRVVHGAKLAIELGPFSFQPSEFVKILFVLFIASAFYRSNSFKMVLITAAFAAVHILLLVFCRDLGTALILFVIYEMMLYVATKKILYVSIGLAGLAAASVAAYHLFSHVQTRIAVWLDPWSDIEHKGWQIAQSLFAIGTGGWFGLGLYQGSPKDIPMVSNDMVFAAISEEMGAIFAILLIFLSLCFTLMMFRVALRVNNSFYKLMAFGFGASYAFQVFLTIGGTIKFIPLTGVNLPLISSGGSSLLASMIICAMIQALYAASETDTRIEREMVMRGAPISDFAGYEHLAQDDDEYPEDDYHHDDKEYDDADEEVVIIPERDEIYIRKPASVEKPDNSGKKIRRYRPVDRDEDMPDEKSERDIKHFTDRDFR